MISIFSEFNQVLQAGQFAVDVGFLVRLLLLEGGGEGAGALVFLVDGGHIDHLSLGRWAHDGFRLRGSGDRFCDGLHGVS